MVADLEGKLPQMIAFDLDYTLWDLWVDTHVTPPIKRRRPDALNSVHDKHGDEMSFYKDVPQILFDLKAKGVHIAACSRTSAPRAARQALSELLVKDERTGDVVSSISFFKSQEIYPGSKITHFKAIHEKTGIPYTDILFFDDEARNMEVQSLGVKMILAPHGVTRNLLITGLEQWRKGNPS